MPKAKNVTVIPATRNLHTGTPMDVKKRRKVAGYARVSTDSDEQFTSYEAQVDTTPSSYKAIPNGSLWRSTPTRAFRVFPLKTERASTV